jgi:transglutaminase-like putative cysteine protease
MRRIRLGCQLRYGAMTATPAVFMVQPAAHPRHLIERDAFLVLGTTPPVEFFDAHGNRAQRLTLQPGESLVRYEATAVVPLDGDIVRADARQVPPEELPNHLLRFTLPSRYAETDRLLSFAWETFSHVPRGWARARAICDWVHDKVEYRRGVSSPQWSAADAIAHRKGVCRDRAHAVIALARAFNMPARYAVSYLPDIDVPDDGNPMDFHAYAEIWLEGGWQVFDPHDRGPRKGRVFLASGLDAADTAFATLYGGANLLDLEVWAEAVPAVTAAPALDRPAAELLAAPVSVSGPPASTSVAADGETARPFEALAIASIRQ